MWVNSSVTSDLDSVHQPLRSGRATLLHIFDFSSNTVRSFSLHRNDGLVEQNPVQPLHEYEREVLLTFYETGITDFLFVVC